MRNPLTALVLVVACFASLSAAAAPNDVTATTTSSENAAAKQEPRDTGEGDLAQQAQNPLLPSWNMIARVVPAMNQPNGSATTSGSSVRGSVLGSVSGEMNPAFFLNYNLASRWYLNNSPFIPASWEAFAADGNLSKPVLAPDWQLRAQIAFLLPE